MATHGGAPPFASSAVMRALKTIKDQEEAGNTTASYATGWFTSFGNLNVYGDQISLGWDEEPQDLHGYFNGNDSAATDITQGSYQLGIPLTSDLYPLRMPGMRLSTSLLPHQVTGIDRIRKAFCDRITRGLIIADSPGLGKPIMAAGFLQHRINAIQQDTAQSTYAKKPWLAVVPLHSIKRFASDLIRYAPDVQICTYSGDPIGSYTHIADLDKHHSLFKKTDAYRTVIITTEQMLCEEHGPEVYLEWLGTAPPDSGLGRLDVTGEDVFISEDWPQSFKGLFEGVIVDEARDTGYIENFNLALFYLDPRFFLLLSNMPFLFGLEHLEGYLHLLQLPEVRQHIWDNRDGKLTLNESITNISYKDVRQGDGMEATAIRSHNFWYPENLKQHGLDTNVNPFVLDHGHPLIALRYSLPAYRKFIKRSMDNRRRCVYIQQIFGALILRRTYESRIPGSLSETISQGLPTIHSRTLRLGFSEPMKVELKDKYEALSKQLYSRKRDSNGAKVLNVNIQEKLQLLSVWLDFDLVVDKMDIQKMQGKHADPDCLYQIISMAAGQASDRYNASSSKTEKGKLVEEIQRASPKLLALSGILSEQVFDNGNNVIVWCSTKRALLLTAALLSASGHNVMTLIRDMRPTDISDLQEKFSQKLTPAAVLVATFDAASFELNFSDACSYEVFLDQPVSSGTSLQAIRCIRRIGRPNSSIHVDELVLDDGFEDMVNQKLNSLTGS